MYYPTARFAWSCPAWWWGWGWQSQRWYDEVDSDDNRGDNIGNNDANDGDENHDDDNEVDNDDSDRNCEDDCDEIYEDVDANLLIQQLVTGPFHDRSYGAPGRKGL